MTQVGDGGVQIAAVAGKLLGGEGVQLLWGAVLRVGGAAEGIKINDGFLPESFAEVLPLAHIVAQLARHKTGPQHTVQLHSHFVAAAAGGALEIPMVADGNHGTVRNIVRGGGHFRIDQRHIPVGCGVMQAAFILVQVFFQRGNQRLVDVFPPLLAGDQGGNIFAQPLHTAGMKPRLSLRHGQDGDGGDVLTAALGRRVKEAHGVQLVAEEFRPHRPVFGGGEDVQNAATDGELTRPLHHAAAVVPGGGETGDQVFHGVFPADFQRKGGGKKRGLRHGAQTERFPRHDLQRGFSNGKVIQLPQALLLPASGHHGGVVKGQIPAGENGGGVRKEALQFLLKPPRRKIVLTQHHHGTVYAAAKPRNHVTAVDLADAGDGDALAVLQRGHHGGVFGNGFQ